MDSTENKIEISDSNNNEDNINTSTNDNNNDNNSLNSQTKFHINYRSYHKIPHQHHHDHIHYPNNSEEENQLSHEHKCRHCSHKRPFVNIGRNYVLCKKYVFGPLNFLFLWLFCNIATVFGWLIWLYAVGDYYPKKIYYALDVLCVVVEYYLILSYITEPGIIPRKCPEYAIKEIEQTEESEKNKEDDKEKPSIYTQRKCPTCQIIRPPGASHCKVCDNCVLDFDHHCMFISNCVGKRNHKYFVLFLVWGDIFAVITMVLVIKTIHYVFYTKYQETLSLVIKHNIFLFILSIILLILCFLYACNPFRKFFQTITTGLTGFGIFWKIWNNNVRKGNVPTYYTPLLFIALIISTGLTLFITANLVQQFYFISIGKTIKQDKSIKDKMEEFKNKNKSNQSLQEYIKKPSCFQIIVNIIKFFCSKIDESLIVPERDLVENTN